MIRRYIVLGAFCLFGCNQQTDHASTKHQYISPDVLYGELFREVQMNRVFADGKTFVDCVPKELAPSEIVSRYEDAKKAEDFDLEKFVHEHFYLPDYSESNFISDTTKTAFEHIESLWDVLSRNPDDVVAGSSLIPLPHPYVVPGGRFREIYYWDSYFTMLGLKVSNRIDLMENMVANFAALIDEVGFIPNGNRTYYLGRSQPPFFAAMVNLLSESNPDIGKKYLNQLVKEHQFWMQGKDQVTAENPTHKHVVRLLDGSILNRYWDDLDTPRPESFREDVETAAHSGRPIKIMYRHLRSGAESGWDYTARWLADGKTLETIHTTDIIPVDLNALLFHLEETIAEIYHAMNDDAASEAFKKMATDRQQALMTYCWDKEMGFFKDYDFVAKTHTPIASLAAAYPLFFKMVTPEQANQVAQYLEDHFLKSGGLLPTLTSTGQQWDAPNGWAPLHWISIEGLRHYQLNNLADTIKNRWVSLNLDVYNRTHKMVEKYNVEDLTLEAGGGEYALQDGFGWSNGVLLKLLSEK